MNIKQHRYHITVTWAVLDKVNLFFRQVRHVTRLRSMQDPISGVLLCRAPCEVHRVYARPVAVPTQVPRYQIAIPIFPVNNAAHFTGKPRPNIVRDARHKETMGVGVPHIIKDKLTSANVAFFPLFLGSPALPNSFLTPPQFLEGDAV